MRILFLLFVSSPIFAQSIGLIKLDPDAYEKLVLISPVNSTDTYLIDECGFIVNQWRSEYRPGLSARLDKDGNLYRAGRINSAIFRAGGLGGIIEKYNWSGELLWQYRLATDSMHLHHDFYLKENGKLLLIAWDLVSDDELEQKARQGWNVNHQFYSETILEIDPTDDFRVTWQWNAIDHVIQDRDSLKSDYGRISDNANRININLNSNIVNNYLDWLHINSVEYDASTGLLLLSCNGIDEIVAIDQTSTSEEAAGQTGGNYGRGGDLIYRWGNPENYTGRLEPDEKYLFKQHDARFIKTEDKIEFSIFNNARIIDGQNYSSVERFELNTIPTASTDIYALHDSTKRVWSYNLDADQMLYSKRMSSAQYLKNRWLICSSDNGRIIEIDEEGKILWEYINPVGPNQVFEQGEIPFGNTLFNAVTYDNEFFQANIDLNPGPDKIEEVNADPCLESNSSQEIGENQLLNKLRISAYQICLDYNNALDIQVFNMHGQKVLQFSTNKNDFCYNYNLEFGIYVIHLKDPLTQKQLLVNSQLGYP